MCVCHKKNLKHIKVTFPLIVFTYDTYVYVDKEPEHNKYLYLL